MMPSALHAWENPLIALASDPPSRSLIQKVSIDEDIRAIRNAYQICQSITAQYSHSFYLASSLLPGEKRRAMRGLYAFCRTADNLADDPSRQSHEQLTSLREGMQGNRDITENPVLTAWADIQARYQIPLRYAAQLLDGVEFDLAPHRYSTFEELSLYCYRVASTVGLMSMHITGYSSPKAVPYAIRLGVALQLTNILRDVGEDWTAGRLYLPLDELAMFGLDEETIAQQTVDNRWRAFMSFQIARTREIYARALPGIGLLHPDGRFAVAAAALLYRGILDDIERHDYNVFSRRAYVDRRRKTAALISAYRYARRTHLPQDELQDVDQIIPEGQHEY